ncbi:MAG: tetrahydrodipicolinate N-succinyltransferase N-terminal domain-containing protein [Limnohabitans sp.]|nr:tetrahydrodipicolinate N-succinyltransferase N-terminal domain-containing protein [Limnohabitans sp.]
MTTTVIPKSVQDFNELVSGLKSEPTYRDPLLFAVGGKVFTENRILASVRFPVVNGPGQNTGTAALLMNILGITPQGVQNVNLSVEKLEYILNFYKCFEADGKKHPNLNILKAALSSKNEIVATFIFDDVPPVGVEDSTLKLYSLSNRLFKPGELNLKNISEKFPNVAWLGDIPIDGEQIDGEQISDKLLMSALDHSRAYPLHMVRKFPSYIHRINILNMGVQVTETSNVSLGAYLGNGTILMPYTRYVNDKGFGIRSGASILDLTPTEWGDQPLSVGVNCLLETNCLLGIPIGDNVTIGENIALLPSTLVQVELLDPFIREKIVEARELAGINSVTFSARGGVIKALHNQRQKKV